MKLRSGHTKPKFFVVASTQPLCTFLINSKPHPWAATREHVQETQYLLRVRNYQEFLHHDSYLDCYEVEALMTYDQLERLVSNSPRCYKGRLSDRDLTAMRARIDMSVSIVRGVKSQILAEVDDCLSGNQTP